MIHATSTSDPAIPAERGTASTVAGNDALTHGWRRVGIGALLLAVVGGTALLAYRTRRADNGGAERLVLAILPFRFDASDPLMVAYERRVFKQLVADARAEHAWTITNEPRTATHLLSGSLTRDGNSVRLFVQLVISHDKRHLWADDIVDSYAFSGNSTLTADRIERSVARVLGAGGRQAPPAPR